jgi:hypothetical protein
MKFTSKKPASKKSSTDSISQKTKGAVLFAALMILGLYLSIQSLAAEQVKPASDEMVAIPRRLFYDGQR